MESAARPGSNSGAFPEVLYLNVGGTSYTTRLGTVTSGQETEPQSDMLCAMFSGRHTVPRDEQGRFFIDRDGRHFHHVLNYLRHKQVTLQCDVFEAYEEAEYYQVPGLLRWGRQQPLWKARHLHQAIGHSLSREDVSFFGQALIQCAVDTTEATKGERSKRPTAPSATSPAEKWFCERPKLLGDSCQAYIRLRLGMVELAWVPASEKPVQAGKKPATGKETNIPVSDPGLCKACDWMHSGTIAKGVQATHVAASIKNVQSHRFKSLHSRDSHIDVLVENKCPLNNRDAPTTLDVLLARTNSEVSSGGLCFMETPGSRATDHQSYCCVGCPYVLQLTIVKLHIDLAKNS